VKNQIDDEDYHNVRKAMLKSIHKKINEDFLRGHEATASEMIINGHVEDKKPSWVRKTWQELKKLGGTVFPVISPAKVAHPGAVDGPKITGKRRFRKANHHERSTMKLTNHERVMMGRARRMRISVAEYRRRYGGEHER